MPLDEYRRKRDFRVTPEPSGDGSATVETAAALTPDISAWERLPQGRRFCVQMHRATRFHFDFRLEHEGVLLSWAMPRGPSLDPADKHLAVHTEDHPVDYGDFEGVIPSGYGAGTVMLWDIGTYSWTRESAEDAVRQISKGDIKFTLSGSKLEGEFALVRLRGRRPGDSGDNWLLIKKRDEHAVSGFVAADLDFSVKTGRSLEQIATDAGGDPREARRAARRTSPARPSRAAAPTGGDAGTATIGEPPSAEGSGGKRPPLPPPMLAVTADRAFSRVGWIYELKYDGVRALVEVRDGAVRVVGRRGRDETSRYPEAQALAARVAAREALLDCEIVVLDDEGRPSFERLQSRINVSRAADIARAARDIPVTFVFFDLLRLEGRDLMSTALRIRKKTLRDVLRPGPPALFADHIERDGEDFFAAIRSRGIEGMVAKRGDSLYQPGARSPDWVKVKAWQAQSCVIGGYTAGRGGRQHLGALVLGVMEGGALVHCGQVGTGLDEATLRNLRHELDSRRVQSSPFAGPVKAAEAVTWVRPELDCEVRHAGWTKAGILRHPAFLGMRPDFAPGECVREEPLPVADVLERHEASAQPRAPARAAGGRASPASAESRPSRDAHIDDALEQLQGLPSNTRWEVGGRSLHLTNLDKLFWPADGITKRDMIAYYVRMAPYLLPYLRDRPLSMQVFPDGIAGKSFWRKDKPDYAPEWMRSWTYHGEKVKDYIVVDEVATLGWVANAGVIDLHPWHSRVDAPESPDWAVFDLDPFEPATFDDVKAIARLVGAALEHFGLRSVLKTSGQTGLQIYVPVRRGPDYDAVRGWVEEVARAIGRVDPARVTWEWSVARRGGQIRIDYTQNIINKTLAAPYSLRPLRGAPVSAPIAWEELDDPQLRPDRWNIATIAARVAEVGDLFVGVLAGDQDLPLAPSAASRAAASFHT
ncbi:MAG TPA: DNA ligase D [Candidatus Sulfotelmatobacter sp.]|nr:DNA ligase D [Candidatus Sulfotelmatobacter sp.]